MASHKKKRGRGRPTLLTEETIQALVEYLEEGYTYAVCCAHAGIHYQSFRNWYKRGEEAKQGEYFDFFDRINRAEMEGRKKLEARALKESRPLDILERRYPQDWGKTERVESTGTQRVVVEWATPEDAKES